MRAQTTTRISRRRRSSRTGRALALGLGICALAIPETAVAQANDGDYSSVNSITGASASEPSSVTGSPSSTDDGFDWVSAAIGAGSALALTALGGVALLTSRRRPPVAPSA